MQLAAMLSRITSFGAVLMATTASGAACLACSTPYEAASAGQGSAETKGGGPNASTAPGANSTAEESPSATSSTGPLGVIVIDVQQVFFDTAGKRNPSINVSSLMSKTAHVFDLVSQSQVPMFITFEATKTGDHALPDSLAQALPSHAQTFIKTTFNATGQPDFAAAVKSSGVSRVLVLGAETDVCVLQSMLGLRRAGLDVIGLGDALFTEEINDEPARRRMRQAGINLVSMDDAEQLITSGAASPAPPANAAPISVKPLQTGVLLHDLAGLSASDPNSAQKLSRMHELLLVTEWFEMPVFADNPDAELAALPSNLRSLITRPVHPLSERTSDVAQLAIAGGSADLPKTVAALSGDVFLLEDALFGVGSADLEPLYLAGAIPSTYKTLYYELIQSVDDGGWPSQDWVARDNPYFDLTSAPEDLPPLAVGH
jgi:nicotinamidase-related amidase